METDRPVYKQLDDYKRKEEFCWGDCQEPECKTSFSTFAYDDMLQHTRETGHKIRCVFTQVYTMRAQ